MDQQEQSPAPPNGNASPPYLESHRDLPPPVTCLARPHHQHQLLSPLLEQEQEPGLCLGRRRVRAQGLGFGVLPCLPPQQANAESSPWHAPGSELLPRAAPWNSETPPPPSPQLGAVRPAGSQAGRFHSRLPRDGGRVAAIKPKAGRGTGRGSRPS